MKKTLLFSALALTLISTSQATTYFGNVGTYAENKVANSLMGGVSSALGRAGSAIGSAASTIARGNVGKLLGGAVATAGGPVTIVGGIAVGLILDYGIGKLTSNSDGTIGITHLVAVSQTQAFATGNLVWTLANSRGYTGVVEATNIGALLPLFLLAQQEGVSKENSPSFYLTAIDSCSVSGTQYFCNKRTYADGHIVNGSFYVGYQKNAAKSCNQGQVYNGTSCIADPSATKTEQTQNFPKSAVATALTEEELNTPVSPSALSNFWNTYAQYSATTTAPIPTTTAEDFASPTGLTVRDLVKPITGSTTPVVNPATASTSEQTATTTNTTTTNNNTTLDLGADPGITTPILNPTIPTEQSILTPYLNLLPDFKNIALGGGGGGCQFGNSFYIYGKPYSFQIVCDLLGQNYSTIHSFMAAFFVIVSVLIILRA